jgi:NAD+-dependent protein deacetylase sirtuin 4
MQKPFMRIPYTGPLPPPLIIPRTANTFAGAVDALRTFLNAPRAQKLQQSESQDDRSVILTGAGISVASGLADYRGESGTYTLNRKYRPIYYSEFLESHLARQRYWARSFLGWTNLHRARPNAAHEAVKALGRLGFIGSVITQSRSP